MAAEGGKHTAWGYRGGWGAVFGKPEGQIWGGGFVRVEASHGIIVRRREVNFGKGGREGGGVGSCDRTSENPDRCPRRGSKTG